MRYEDYVRFVEDRYFGNVSRDRQAEVLDCFTADAEILIRHGDLPVRHLKARPEPGEPHLGDFWKHLNGNFAASFTAFEHFVDVAAQRCAATFTVTLTPRPGSAYAAQGVQTLQNCNFFWFRDERVRKMIVYYSNSAGQGPTGYPPLGYRAP
jgi:hypothetical protein